MSDKIDNKMRPTNFLGPFQEYSDTRPKPDTLNFLESSEEFSNTRSKPDTLNFLKPFEEFSVTRSKPDTVNFRKYFEELSDTRSKTDTMNFLEPFEEFSDSRSKPDTLNFLESDSAYSTLQNTPESEFPSNNVDWSLLSKELDSLLVTSSPFVPKVLKPQGVNFAFSDCFFSIEGIELENKTSWEDDGFEDVPSSLDIRIIGPSGQLYTTKVFADYNTLHCTFRPVEIGLHRGEILSEFKHIEGSPFETVICRDYENVTEGSGPVVNMDVEMTSVLEEGSHTMQVKKPWGIACISKTEQILVADREHHEILVFKPDGELDFTFGNRGSGPAQFFRPTSVAYDPINEKIYVGDKDNHRIQTFNNKGEYLSSFGTRGYRAGQLMYPWGLAVSKCGNLVVVADTRNHRIQLFTPAGQFLRQFPVRTNKNEFNHPRGVVFDLAGENIYVSDFNLNCIFKVDISFSKCTKIVDESVLRRPQGLAIDAAGNLLVADSRHNSIKVFLPSGAFLQEFSKLSSSVFMDLPLDLSVMPAGFLAILDLNGRVNVI